MNALRKPYFFTNPKKTGEKSIMGNQSMTSLKFTAFFAIALMLVAGLFSTTATALAGMVTITPSDVWEGEMNKNFIVTYTAEGQMSDSTLQLKIPDSLIPDAGTAEEEAAFIESKLTISQSGNVVFGDAADIDATDDEDATVTIYINSMYAGDSVYLRYEGINVQALDVDLSTEELEVIGADNEGPGYEAFEVFTDSGRAGEPAGKIHPQQGSGDATLTPESVLGGSTQNFTLDYISHTTLENVYIWIYTPHNYAVDTEDPAFAMANGEEILLTATGDYGYLSSAGLPAGATQVIVDGGKGAVWGPLNFNRGDTFSRTIHNVSITDKPSAYTWDVHLATVDPVNRAGVVDGIGERNPNGLLGLTWSNHLVSPDLQILRTEPTHMFKMALASGLNMISLPLMPAEPYTASSFAEAIGATVVIQFDTATEQFAGFTSGQEGDGFPIEGGKGYIVNVPGGGTVTFTGTVWSNTMEDAAAAPGIQLSSTTWAFVVSGDLLETEAGVSYTVVAKNHRTGEVATKQVSSDHKEFNTVWADLTRKSVIEVGDTLEVTLIDEWDNIVSGPFTHQVGVEDLRNAYFSLPLTVGDVHPAESILGQNFPNPFNPETWIPYQLEQSADVVLQIYDPSGRTVRTIDLGFKPQGFYMTRSTAAYWDGRNNMGEQVASGVYFYSLQTPDFSATRKMLILK